MRLENPKVLIEYCKLLFNINKVYGSIMVVNQLKAGAFLSYISIVLHNIIGLLYTPFMLRMLGQSEYGLYSLVESVVAYLTILDLALAMQ